MELLLLKNIKNDAAEKQTQFNRYIDFGQYERERVDYDNKSLNLYESSLKWVLKFAKTFVWEFVIPVESF